MFDVNQDITAGNTLVREAIQSQNFVTGVAGWQIKADGNAEFNNVTIRGRIIGGNSAGVHIEINGSDAPNGIAFYTGNANETFPGVIQPADNGPTDLSLTQSSPLVTGHAGSSLALSTGIGAQLDSAQLGSANTLISGSATASMTGPIIGVTGINTAYYLNTDGTGQYADIIAPRIFLRDNSAGANDNGLVSIGPLIQPISARWFTTTDTPLTGTWVDTAGARFGYYKDANGIVHLRGLIRNGAAVAMVTLPAGFRPSSNLDFTVQNKTTGGIASIGVSTAGLVQISTNFVANTMQVYLDVITFPTL